MKHLLYLILTLALGACGGSTDTDPVSHDSAAKQSSLAQLRGQWVVINYWAQWCTPCIKEIPELNELDRQYANITVVGVNYDDASGQDLAQQVAKLGIKFAMLGPDPAAELGVPRPVVLPTTLILDPAGQLATTLVGPQTLESLAQATGQRRVTLSALDTNGKQSLATRP